MDLSGVRQHILHGDKTANEKAELLMLKGKVNDLSLEEWRALIAGIPQDVKKQIGILMSAEIRYTDSVAVKMDVLKHQQVCMDWGWGHFSVSLSESSSSFCLEPKRWLSVLKSLCFNSMLCTFRSMYEVLGDSCSTMVHS